MAEESRQRPQVHWVSLGRVEYEDGLRIQQERVDALLGGRDERQTVFALEHPPTITIGRHGTMEHVLASPEEMQAMGMRVYEVDRGGDVTYHGPGQFVMYPILHLDPWENDVGRYVRMLEECAIRALASVGIQAGRLEGYPGAWVADRKICAVGVRMRRRPSGELVTSHGLAINVTTNLRHFSAIIPCGITDKGVTSVEELLGRPLPMQDWEARMRSAFAEVFDVDWAAE
jgi:lipoyl(octanoyl) transferase